MKNFLEILNGDRTTFLLTRSFSKIRKERSGSRKIKIAVDISVRFRENLFKEDALQVGRKVLLENLIKF